MYKYILDGALGDAEVNALLETFGDHEVAPRAGFCEIKSLQKLGHETIQQISSRFGRDLNCLPQDFDPESVKLVISDMDSTFISIECIDEIADFAGKKAEVSAVTEAAMRGELDFCQSLTQRVALLNGLPVEVLDKVYGERLTLNPGAEVLLLGLKNSDIRFALVSGGFTYFTDKLKAQYGLDFARANTLSITDGKLLGSVDGEIVDGSVKRSYLQSLCAELGISPKQAVAMGDGANDLQMMEIAGLGVAYKAKPKVQQQAGCAINYGGLDGVLSLLGIDKPE